MRGRPSRTADGSAAQRAAHTLHGAEPKVFEDPYALALCGRWRWLVGPTPMAWLTDRVLFRWARPLVGLHLARARYVEELVAERADGPGRCQYVLVGAGMDSFALRKLKELPEVRVFELDHPATQALKRRRMAEGGLSVPSTVEFCPVDFERQSVADALAGTTFDPARPCVFSWMGVAPYLTEDAIRKTTTAVRSVAAPGSDLVFDAVDRAVFTEGVESPTGKRLLRFAAARGEPVLSAFDPPEWAGVLGDDFEVAAVLDAGAMTRRWFQGRSDGIEPWRHTYLVHARRR